MNRNPLPVAVATALLCSLALVGCKKKDEPVPAPVVIDTPSTAPAPMPMPASTATATVTGIDLGNSAGADMRIGTPMTSFGKMDTIMAAVATSTSQPAAMVPAKMAAKWTYQAIYRVADNRVGQWSNPVSIAVGV